MAVPTETVYGLAADAQNELAVRRIFAVKGRPSTHPLIVHLAQATDCAGWVREFPPEAEALARAFWPGPLTLVLPRGEKATDAVTGGQDTVALRVPAHPLTQELLTRLGGGIAAPSANRFGRVSPTTAGHVRGDLGNDVEFILDGGPCSVGLESTIIDLSHGAPALLRPGGLPKEEIEQLLHRPLALRQTDEVRVPGTLPSHYAPRAGLFLVEPGELTHRAAALVSQGKKVAVLGRSGMPLVAGAVLFVLPDEPGARARELYGTLRKIDEAGFEVIVSSLPAAEGLDLAVRDRLTRAAAPRP